MRLSLFFVAACSLCLGVCIVRGYVGAAIINSVGLVMNLMVVLVEFNEARR